jgi:hypothetical protein
MENKKGPEKSSPRPFQSIRLFLTGCSPAEPGSALPDKNQFKEKK